MPISQSEWAVVGGSWVYNYLCNQCLSPLMLWVRIQLRRGVFDTILYDKVCQWLATGRWFSTCTPVSLHQSNWPPIYRYNWNIAEVALNTSVRLLMRHLSAHKAFSRIIFIGYDPSLKFGKLNNLKIFGSEKTNGSTLFLQSIYLEQNKMV